MKKLSLVCYYHNFFHYHQNITVLSYEMLLHLYPNRNIQCWWHYFLANVLQLKNNSFLRFLRFLRGIGGKWTFTVALSVNIMLFNGLNIFDEDGFGRESRSCSHNASHLFFKIWTCVQLSVSTLSPMGFSPGIDWKLITSSTATGPG